MNIQKIATVIAITTSLGLMSLTPAQANDRQSRYSNYGSERHDIQNNRRANKSLRHEIRENRRANKAIRHEIRDNRKANKIIRHQAREERHYNAQVEHRRDKRRVRQHDNYRAGYINNPLEHRYKHKRGIPHRHAAGVAVPHKSWRKQHQRWDYARFDGRGYQNNLQVRFIASNEPHDNRYNY